MLLSAPISGVGDTLPLSIISERASHLHNIGAEGSEVDKKAGSALHETATFKTGLLQYPDETAIVALLPAGTAAIKIQSQFLRNDRWSREAGQ
jgi:hypothetical protein